MTSINFGGNVQVTGDFNVVVANSIQNSFNRVAESNVNDDLKSAVKDLGVHVAELAKQLPEAQQQQVARDFDVLAKEAIAPKPRREWYELSAKGLLEAAKTVAAMAEPLTRAVKAVLGLLG